MGRVLAAIAVFLAVSLEASVLHAADLQSLWDYRKPQASEARFRAALAGAQGDWALELRTQIARTHSLRRQFDAAHSELDAVLLALPSAGLKPQLRYALERGRTFNSAGQKDKALPLFTQAWSAAVAGGEEDLALDAAHMVAIVQGGEAALATNLAALPLAQGAKDPGARRWLAPLLNNIGNELRSLKRFPEALDHFERAEAAYVARDAAKVGYGANVRFASWQVANTLRLLGRLNEAIAAQLRLADACEAAGEPDGHVYEELAELYAAVGNVGLTQSFASRAAALLGADAWFAAHEPARLARLKSLAGAGL